MEPPSSPPPGSRAIYREPQSSWKQSSDPTSPVHDINFQWEQMNGNTGTPGAQFIPFESEGSCNPENLTRFMNNMPQQGEYWMPDIAREQRVILLNGQFLGYELVKMPFDYVVQTHYYVHNTMVTHWHVAYCMYRTCRRFGATFNSLHRRRFFRQLGPQRGRMFIILLRVICSMLEQTAEVWETQLAGAVGIDQDGMPFEAVEAIPQNAFLRGTISNGVRSAIHMHNAIADGFDYIRAAHENQPLWPGGVNDAWLFDEIVQL